MDSAVVGGLGETEVAVQGGGAWEKVEGGGCREAAAWPLEAGV